MAKQEEMSEQLHKDVTRAIKNTLVIENPEALIFVTRPIVQILNIYIKQREKEIIDLIEYAIEEKVISSEDGNHIIGLINSK